LIKIIIIISTILLTTSSIAALNTTIKNSLKFKIKTNAKPIDEDFIQEIINGITNGLVPRIVLAKVCEDYFLTRTKEASLSGNSIIKSLEIDLPENLLAKGFGSLWQVCENNGAALSPALNQFAQQIRTEKELREELSSSMSGAKLSAWVLAGLPLFGIVLAGFLGVNSLQWLMTSSIGNYNIAAALILEITGIIWVSKITSRIENLL
jgi:tight adherence protein B